MKMSALAIVTLAGASMMFGAPKSDPKPTDQTQTRKSKKIRHKKTQKTQQTQTPTQQK